VRERLAISLSLDVGGAAHSVQGGDVRGFSLELTPWGAEGWVEWILQDDKRHGGKYEDDLLADFVKPDLGELTISIKAVLTDAQKSQSLPEIATRGLIVDKAVTEEVYERGVERSPVLFRRYRATFKDPARLLWGQHHPVDLHVQKSFKDVLDAHKGAKIELTYDFEPIAGVVPLIFFHLDPERGASFHDLLIWYLDGRAGVLTYDHVKGSYSIKAEKEGKGKPATLHRDDVTRLTSVLPEVPRHKPRVVCSYTGAAKRKDVDAPQAAAGIYRDVLLRTPIAQQVDDRVTLEGKRPLVPQRMLHVELARYPVSAVTPGSLVDISGKGGFSSEMLPSADPLRVVDLLVSGSATDQGPEESYGEKATWFELSIGASLEAKSDRTLRLPPFSPPWFPGYLEGKVVSSVGEEKEVTYEVVQDQDTSVDTYKVAIPLFADLEITVPFEPPFSSGTLYLPLYKDQRVLVALWFDHARVERLLDYRPGARVPQAGQGQHLLLGKSDESNTSVLHDYQDGKPVYRILRTNAKDTSLFRMEEGRLTIQVKEAEGG
jgi:hypothetical protein